MKMDKSEIVMMRLMIEMQSLAVAYVDIGRWRVQCHCAWQSHLQGVTGAQDRHIHWWPNSLE